MPLFNHIDLLPEMIELPGEPYEPQRTLYNCLEHYKAVPGHIPQESGFRVKVLRVRTLYPYQRCISELQEHLGDRWRRVQEHPHIAAAHFCEALEHARGLPRISNLPVVLVMPEYQANIMEYVERFHPSISQRTQWLLQTANALQYLHDNEIIHGNLYPGNILIGNEGNAYVADAMIFTTIIACLVPDHVASDLRFPNSLPFKTARAIHEKRARWADPTLHDDLFAFAVTCWSVYAGKDPFPMYSEVFRTVLRIGKGEHKELQRVAGMSDSLWGLLRTILAQDIPPSKWPSLKNLLSQLEANDT